MSRPHPPARKRGRAPDRRRAGTAIVAATGAAGLALVTAGPAAAVNYVTTENGASWGIHDAAAPALDTGAVRSITTNAFYGFGGIRLSVPGIPATDPTARFNNSILRGFGLTFNGSDSFETTTPVTLGGIQASREIKVDKTNNSIRYLDTFANTTDHAISIDTAFGGTVGLNTQNAAGTTSNQAAVANTASGDTTIDGNDSWVELSSPAPGAASAATGPSSRGPSAVVLGTPSPFGGALTGLGNFERNPFVTALAPTGLDADFYGYRSTVTLQPGQVKSLLRFVVAGKAETAGTAGTEITKVGTAAANLATSPNLSGLTATQICGLSNWDPKLITGFDFTVCDTAPVAKAPAEVKQTLAVTSSPYDVVNKSITQMGEDMKNGVTTSQQITRAYLDRIAAYDEGPFGNHAFITVAKDAMEQAKAADDRRAAGDEGDLVGIPMVIKDLYDTKDMPTTDGSLSLKDWQPKKDAFQVARLRAAGVVMLGKGNLSEFANSGSYSDSGFGMTANAFDLDKSSLGSSGGPAVATALSLAGAALGTQTGVSLYAPSTGASLVSLRGTDGISSGSGVMPLTYLQDFEGPIARTTSDVARILNVTTGTDPTDPATVHADADAKRPADWTASLDKNALQGKRIGYVPAAFTGSPSYGQNDGTGQAVMDRFSDLVAAGATMVRMVGNQPSTVSSPSTNGRSRTEEGWQSYWEEQIDPPFTTAAGILSSPKNLPYNRMTVDPAPRLTTADVDGIMSARDKSKANYKAWMDANTVDAVVYPGFRSDVYDNDGAQTLSSDRNSNVPTSNFGLPTLILPVGANPHGQPISLQIVGAAFDDAKVLGFGYALEQQLGGAGHLVPANAPALKYEANAPTPPVTEPTTPIAPVTVPPAPDKPTENAAPPATSRFSASVPAVKPALQLTFPTGAKLKGIRAKVVVKNTGSQTVVGTVLLKGKVKVGGKTVIRTFGSVKVTITPGFTKTVSVKLNATGVKALRAKKTARVTITYTLSTAPAASSTTTKSLTLRR